MSFISILKDLGGVTIPDRIIKESKEGGKGGYPSAKKPSSGKGGYSSGKNSSKQQGAGYSSGKN